MAPRERLVSPIGKGQDGLGGLTESVQRQKRNATTVSLGTPGLAQSDVQDRPVTGPRVEPAAERDEEDAGPVTGQIPEPGSHPAPHHPPPHPEVHGFSPDDLHRSAGGMEET